MVLTTVTPFEDAYFEITKRLLDNEIFEGSILDLYADVRHSGGGIFEDDLDTPDINELLYMINEEMQYVVEQFCVMSGVTEDDIHRAINKWNDEVFPILPRLIERTLIQHNLPFINTYELIGISTHSDNILKCQNVIFPQFKEVAMR